MFDRLTRTEQMFEMFGSIFLDQIFSWTKYFLGSKAWVGVTWGRVIRGHRQLKHFSSSFSKETKLLPWLGPLPVAG